MISFFTEPREAPNNVECFSLSTTSVMIQWKPPPQSTHNGVLKEYKVILKKLGDEKFEKTEYTEKMEFAFHDLRWYTTYSVQVAARTSKGDGPRSAPKKVSTSLFGKYVDCVSE